MIGVSSSTLWAIIAKGEITARRIGGSTVILRRDLEAFVESAPIRHGFTRSPVEEQQ